MKTIEQLPQTAYFWYEGKMHKCTHNVVTKGNAPRVRGYRTCCVCFHVIWMPVDDKEYMTDGEYDEDKIKQWAESNGVPYHNTVLIK